MREKESIVILRHLHCLALGETVLTLAVLNGAVALRVAPLNYFQV